MTMIRTSQATVTVVFLETDAVTLARRTMVLHLWDDELSTLVEAADGDDLVHLVNEDEEVFVRPHFIKEIKVERGGLA